MSHDESTMFSTKSLRLSTDFRCRLYAALAADEQRRVVQLSFTGCMNFCDVSDMDVGWYWYMARGMDETPWKWLEWWVNWRRVGKNHDWADMSKDALIIATHAFDMTKKQQLFKPLQKSFARLCVWNFSLNMLKGHDFIHEERGTFWFWSFQSFQFGVRELPAFPTFLGWSWSASCSLNVSKSSKTFCPNLRFFLEHLKD